MVRAFSLEDRIAALTELRNNIQSKQKSLKRRRGESSVSSSTVSLKEGLTKLLEELSTLIDLTRRLNACAPTEGKNLYDAILAVSGLTVGQEVWKRAMKAWTYEAGPFFWPFFLEGATVATAGCSERLNRIVAP